MRALDELKKQNARKKEIILDAICAMIFYNNEIGKNRLDFDFSEMRCGKKLADEIVNDLIILGYKAKIDQVEDSGLIEILW